MIIDIFIIIFVLISIILSCKYKFIQFKFLKVSYKTLNHSVRNKENKHKAFLLSLGNHIGAGNIVGVCSAILIGGVGSLFWMSVCLLFTSIYSLIENSLGVKYNMLIDGEYRGGSPYYILSGMNNKKLSIVFACVLLLSSTVFFLPVQVNALKESIKIIFDFDKIYIFLILLLFSLLCLFKGTKRILKISDFLVPLMTIMFVLVCFLVIIINIKQVPSALYLILKEAFCNFDFKTIIGSIFGGSISVGFRRSVFSNEAGIGTAPSFNSMVETDPLEQAYLQVFACFIDTVVMCTLFGLVIILSGIEYKNYDASSLAIKTFECLFNNKWGLYLGSLFLFFFSFVTIIGSYYSGETNSLFFGNKKTKKVKNIYRIIFSICLFLGVFFKENTLWELVDYGIVILGIINVYVMIKMRRKFEDLLAK